MYCDARTQNAAWANLFWSPVPRVNIGVEFNYQEQRVKVNDGIEVAGNVLPVGSDDSEAFKVQFGALFLY